MKPKRKPKLKPVGSGSDAEEYGYRFDLLLSWLESIRDHELELSESKPQYTERAEKLSDAVDSLCSLT
jgi:hypothetical protein